MQHPSYCQWVQTCLQEDGSDTNYRLARLAHWLNAPENVPVPETMATETPTSKPTTGSGHSTDKSQSPETMTLLKEMATAVTQLKLEMQELKQERETERPRKKAEKADSSQADETSFSVVTSPSQ